MSGRGRGRGRGQLLGGGDSTDNVKELGGEPESKKRSSYPPSPSSSSTTTYLYDLDPESLDKLSMSFINHMYEYTLKTLDDHEETFLKKNDNNGAAEDQDEPTEQDRRPQVKIMSEKELHDYTYKMQNLFFAYLQNTYLPLRGRIKALKGLGLCKTPEALKFICTALEDKSCSMCLEAIILLEKLTPYSDRIIPILGNILNNKSRYYLIRRRAAEALIYIGDARSCSYLSNNIDDEEDSIRKACLRGVAGMIESRQNSQSQLLGAAPSPPKPPSDVASLPKLMDRLSLNPRQNCMDSIFNPSKSKPFDEMGNLSSRGLSMSDDHFFPSNLPEMNGRVSSPCQSVVSFISEPEETFVPINLSIPDDKVVMIGEYLKNSKNPLASRARSLYILGLVGNELASALVVGCFTSHERSAFLKQQLTYTLGQIKHPSGIRMLKTIINSTEPSMIRKEAALSLGMIGTPACEEILGKCLEDKGLSPSIKLACGVAKENIGNPSRKKLRGKYQAIDPVFRLEMRLKQSDVTRSGDLLLYHDNSPSFMFGRIAAVLDLRDIGTDAAINALCKGMVGCKNGLVQQIIARSLGQLCDPSSFELLAKTLGDDDTRESVRIECALAIAAFGNSKAVSTLTNYLSSSAKPVQESCRVGIDICKRKMNQLDYTDPSDFFELDDGNTGVNS